MTEIKSLKQKIFSGVFWKLLERTSVQFMQIAVQIILARLLLPQDFGVVAIVMVFIHIADIIVQSGFSTALIQKQNIDNLDYSSVFFFSIGLSILFYTVIYLISPAIATFYKMPILKVLLPVLAITLIPGSLNSVQIAYAEKQMNFKILFKCNLLSIIISSFVSIVMAFLNFGVWALVVQKLIYQFLFSFILLFCIEWKPSFIISFARLKEIYNYGVFILGVSLIERIYRESLNLVVGKIYGPSQLAYYNRGESFPVMMLGNINDGTQAVMFSALSSKQGNKDALRTITARNLKSISLIVVPVLMGLFVTGKNLILLLLTEKWLPCLLFLQVSCIKFLFYPLYSSNIQVLKALGKSKVYFYYVIFHKIIMLVIITMIFKKGIETLILLDAITFIIYSLISSIPNKKYIGYGLKEQLLDLIPIYLISFVMSFLVYMLDSLRLVASITFLLQIIVGFLTFIYLAYKFRLESLHYLKDLIRNKVYGGT